MAKTNGQYLLPCQIYVSKLPTEITTVLGSCIAVCLWDQLLKFGGMNHYMLPEWDGDGMPSARFGNIAIKQLVERMTNLGCERPNLVAKVFGGSQTVETGGAFNVGTRNAMLARTVLQEYRIPIVGSDVGGLKGRKIIFNTETGIIYMRYLRESE